ncbi:hypothetical protein E2C01_095325 [Portunus trituberculatus]|uniref:Uncharacterized protein n=1 Tax=Portunus trituberculatus TaxID=210409 RepID=A0A5B7JSR6_PORTR|nr:hypothetical protein [Portunus trituberculatus]
MITTATGDTASVDTQNQSKAKQTKAKQGKTRQRKASWGNSITLEAAPCPASALPPITIEIHGRQTPRGRPDEGCRL